MRFKSLHLALCAAAVGCLFSTTIAQAETTKILVAQSYFDRVADLSEEFSDLQFVPFTSVADLLSKVSDADAIVGLSSHPTGPVVTAGKKLRWMQTMSAGVEITLADQAVRDSDVTLTNAKIIQGPEIADHALALLLCYTRDIRFSNSKMKTVGFERSNELPEIELRGKTALVVGVGGIGRQVAERCFAFGMRVIAVDPKDMPLTRAIEDVRKPDEVNDLLPEADVVIICTPHTPESEGMIGAEQFAVMKDNVYFINVSRGKIVDTEALTAALQSGKVRAAGLDVTDPEPLPRNHPLWSMSNVTITPHIATKSDNLEQRRTKLFRDNIARFMTGKPLRNVVNKGPRY